MRIAAASLERFSQALPMEVGNGSARWRHREGLLLRLMDDEGELGQGEASPLPDYSKDTTASAADALTHVPWTDAPELDTTAAAARSIPTFVEAVKTFLDRSLPAAREPAARFAAETALFDLAGRALDLPLHELFPGVHACEPGGAPSEPGVLRSVPLNAWIGSFERETLVRGIEAARARGISIVKLKIGRAGRFEEELRTLVHLRNRFGPGLGLRLDVNEAWGLDEACRCLDALARVAPEYVEQPVAARDLPMLAESPVPLAADESLRDPGALEKLLAGVSACRVFVVKPMVLGGFLASQSLAREASRRGIGVVVSHLLDGPVALAAAMELALSLEPRPLACGLDLHPGLAAWPETTIHQHQGDSIRPGTVAGLGVSALAPASPEGSPRP